MGTTPIAELLNLLWRDYAAITPQVQRVQSLLGARGEKLVNDHFALRTFAHERVDIELLDRAFVDSGYEPIESYEFPHKKLVACHYEHPQPGMPKLFISSLLLDEMSAELRETVHGLLKTCPQGIQADWRFAASGRLWDLSHQTYQALYEESPYAAWVAAFGFRANHFTIAAHELCSVVSLQELNDVLEAEGLRLNAEGGKIKGSAALGLEQSSTMADVHEMAFVDGRYAVPACYCEFAYRHKDSNGKHFQGFVAESADKIFESTQRE